MTKKPNKKSNKKPSKKTKASAKKTKKKSDNIDDLDLVFVDEDITIDKKSELEARKAYLEEARSQESSGD